MSKDCIIFVNAIRPATFEALIEYEKRSGRRFEPIVLVDQKIKDLIFECNGQNNLPQKVTVLVADFSSAASVRAALRPFEDRIFAVTAQYENCIQELRQLLPYIPYLPTPTEKSLLWSTEKKLMRQMLEAYDPSLVPEYMEVADATPKTIEKIEETLSYPVVVKPSGLEGSLLVSYVNDRNELEATLSRTFSSMQASYDEWVKRQKPVMLVEEFMAGRMYTIDVYVDAHGKCYYTPIIKTIVGREVGYEDLFPYMELLPADLSSAEEEKGQEAAQSACHALGMRSITVHVELMLTAGGWKVIELGPRIGGWRHELLKEGFGSNHIVNDILVRAGEEPEIQNTLKKYVVQIDIYAREEGMLRAIHGIDTVESLPSFTKIRQTLFVGQKASFAKNGGDVIISLVLSHVEKNQLEKDIAATEAAITFDVEPAA